MICPLLFAFSRFSVENIGKTFCKSEYS